MFSTATGDTKRSSVSLLTALLFAFTTLPAQALTQNITLDGVLAARKAALAALHVHPARTLEVSGLLSGTGMEGAFYSWVAGDDARYEEQIGVREETSLRSGGKVYIINQSGDVRQLRGLLLQRQHTQDFIDTDGFVSQPKYDTFGGTKQLPDGRSVYEIVVAPPGGQPETLDLDAKTLMIDRISYDEEDGTSTQDFYNYSTFAGALVAQREVDSNGDHLYDMVRYTDKVRVNRPIPKDKFAVPKSTVIQADAPVTVPLIEHAGHYYTRVSVNHHDFTFLVDTGAQAIVLDSRVAQALGLRVQGHLEVAGAQRTGGMGVAQLDSVQIGTGSLPVHIAAVLDLHGATGVYDTDGVLGYPFFAAAEVTIDPVAKTMTFAKPGMLHPPGTAVNVDVDRQLVEMAGKVNGADGRFVIDTGNSTELLIFEPYMQAHPYLVGFQQRQFSNDYGVGGAARAVSAIVDELDMGDYRLFNRNASLMLTDQGAFADRFDAGNIGMGVLKNFVVTFDVANAQMYLQRSTAFDDGRYRPRLESSLGP